MEAQAVRKDRPAEEWPPRELSGVRGGHALPLPLLLRFLEPLPEALSFEGPGEDWVVPEQRRWFFLLVIDLGGPSPPIATPPAVLSNGLEQRTRGVKAASEIVPLTLSSDRRGPGFRRAKVPGSRRQAGLARGLGLVPASSRAQTCGWPACVCPPPRPAHSPCAPSPQWASRACSSRVGMKTRYMCSFSGRNHGQEFGGMLHRDPDSEAPGGPSGAGRARHWQPLLVLCLRSLQALPGAPSCSNKGMCDPEPSLETLSGQGCVWSQALRLHRGCTERTALLQEGTRGWL